MTKFEVVSDLMDGQLQGEPLRRALDSVTADEQALQAWHAYQVIGDAMRSADLAQSTDHDFVRRLLSRLQTDPMPVRQSVAIEPVMVTRAAANDGWFAWKRVAGVMSIFAVLAVGWNLSQRPAGGADSGEVAQAPGGVVTRVSADVGFDTQRVMLRDARLDQLIQAHRQSGAGSALQVSSGFLRNATYEVTATGTSNP